MSCYNKGGVHIRGAFRHVKEGLFGGLNENVLYSYWMTCLVQHSDERVSEDSAVDLAEDVIMEENEMIEELIKTGTVSVILASYLAG